MNMLFSISDLLFHIWFFLFCFVFYVYLFIFICCIVFLQIIWEMRKKCVSCCATGICMRCSKTRVHRHEYIYVSWYKIKLEHENETKTKWKKNSTLSKREKTSCGKFNATSRINLISFFLCHFFRPTSLVYLMLVFVLLLFICHVEKISLHGAFSRVFNQSKEYSFNFISFNFLLNLSLNTNANARCHSMSLMLLICSQKREEKFSYFFGIFCDKIPSELRTE